MHVCMHAYNTIYHHIMTFHFSLDLPYYFSAPSTSWIALWLHSLAEEIFIIIFVLYQGASGSKLWRRDACRHGAGSRSKRHGGSKIRCACRRGGWAGCGANWSVSFSGYGLGRFVIRLEIAFLFNLLHTVWKRIQNRLWQRGIKFKCV